MKKNQKFSKFAILIAIILSSIGSLYAQTFDNTGGTYEANTNAVLRMNNSTALNPLTNLGIDATTGRLQGIVDWAGTGAGQLVQALYYTNLFLSGGTKTINNGVYVGGNGTALTPYAGYANLLNTGATKYGYYATSGNRTYTDRFYYDGNDDQTLFSEAGITGDINQYDILNLLSYDNTSLKTTGGDIFLKKNLELEVSATMTNAFNFQVEEGISYAKGNLTNTAGSFKTLTSGTFDIFTPVLFTISGGFLSLQSTGNFTVQAGGTLTLTEVAATKSLEMLNASYMDVTGVFTNLATNHANMTFSDASTVRYSGTTGNQNVVATVNTTPTTNPYSNLIFIGAAVKELETANTNADIYSRGNVSIEGGNILLSATNINATDMLRTFYVSATGGNKVTYTGTIADDPYVQGNMELWGTLGVGPYTLNNVNTTITFATGKIPTTFGFNVQSAKEPPLLANFNSRTDVNRSVYANFTGAGFVTNLKVGYNNADLTGGADGAFGSAPENVTGDNLRFKEGFSAGSNAQSLIGNIKATNSGIIANTPHWVNLTGDGLLNIELIASGTPPGGTGMQLQNGSNVIMTAAPMLFIAVNNGRWTNPNTWDEGVVPSSTDNTIIRAVVYAGIDGPAYGTTITNNTTSEKDYLATGGWNNTNVANQLANQILIDPDPGATKDYALIIGNEDNGANYPLRTALEGVTSGTLSSGLINNSLGNSSLVNWDLKTNTPDGTNIFGLWITNRMTPDGGGQVGGEPVFGASMIDNNGTIVNHGILEVGDKK